MADTLATDSWVPLHNHRNAAAALIVPSDTWASAVSVQVQVQWVPTVAAVADYKPRAARPWAAAARLWVPLGCHLNEMDARSTLAAFSGKK